MPAAAAPDPLFDIVQRALGGRYILERELGRGGAGVVYLAREVELDRQVALKVLPPERTADVDARARFVREARTAASLSHPNIVPIHRVGEAGPIVYFSMEYIAGETLGERLRSRGPLSPSAAIRLLREVSQALAYAHANGVVHRDIKADNILLERASGRALVTDFGIAAGVAGASAAGAVGTPHFMSPEQAAGRPSDERSDLYSLGVVAHVALSGMLPRRTQDSGAGIGMQSLAGAAPVTPRHLVLAVDRALRADPAERFETAEAFAKAVEATLVTRPGLPPALRAFLDSRDPWRIAYIYWFLMNVLLAAGMALRPRLAEVAGFFVFLAFCPVLPAVLFQLRAARRLFEDGYTTEDLPSAFELWRGERAEENPPPAKAGWHRLARGLAWGAFGLFGLEFVFGFLPDAAAWLGLLGLGSLPLLSALGIPLLPPGMRSRSTRSLREKFWTSELGRLTERLLMHGQRIRPPEDLFRPTEAILGTTVDDLFRALPRALRDELREVPATVERLQAHGAAARSVLCDIDAATSDDPADIGSGRLREYARRQLSDSVAAIETIRLDLLRLLGGEADLRPSATVLEAARQVGDDLDRLRQAQAELSTIARPLAIELRATTPA